MKNKLSLNTIWIPIWTKKRGVIYNFKVMYYSVLLFFEALTEFWNFVDVSDSLFLGDPVCLWCKALIQGRDRPYTFRIFLGYPLKTLFIDNFGIGNPPGSENQYFTTFQIPEEPSRCCRHGSFCIWNVDKYWFSRGGITNFLKRGSGCNTNRVFSKKMS